MKYINRVLIILLFLAILPSSMAVKAQGKSSDTIKESITQLLTADYRKRGFIIIEGRNNLEYVQFGREHYGLMLMWPFVNDKSKGLNEINRVKFYLDEKQFKFKNIIHITRQDILNLQKEEYIQDSEGIYANCGNNADEITELVKHLFQNIYGYSQIDDMRIELVLDNS